MRRSRSVFSFDPALFRVFLPHLSFNRSIVNAYESGAKLYGFGLYRKPRISTYD